MRKPILLLAVVALGTAACSGSSATPYTGNTAAAGAPLPDRRPGLSDRAPVRAGAPPTATPYDGVTYQDPGVNPFVPAERDRKSTFALDVDTASYTIAQR